MKKGDITKKILLAAAGVSPTGGPTALVGIDKALHSLGLWYKSRDRRSRYRVRKSFSELKKSGLIRLPENSDAAKISLTEDGRKKVLAYQIEEMRMEKPKKWDKKWRMVIFDIPENFKNARNVLRNKLKEFGFYALQRSIWLYPYDCRNEISFISGFLEVKQYVKLIEATRFDGEESVKQHFNL